MTRPSRTGFIPAIKDANPDERKNAGLAVGGLMFAGTACIITLAHFLGHGGEALTVTEALLMFGLGVLAWGMLRGDKLSSLAGVIRSAREVRNG